MSAAPTASELVKAHIQILSKSETPKTTVPVRFNPTEYRLSKSVSYGDQQVAGMTSPLTQFVSGDAETLSMELFVDLHEQMTDVRVFTTQLDQLVELDSERHAPPKCRFVWGSLSFKAVVESLEKRFTLFRAGGIPTRARIDITFREYTTPKEQTKRAKLQSADRTTLWEVTESDTLPLIAAEEYGDPERWRPIAERNDLADPRNLETGTVLVIPSL